ncbi:hypothetical protein SPI_02569 [Niveomyces insectorum RCEF 264]|uniref:DUF1793-domain-containing protein n=1 Tax=Niveomyces insectorum RCEF 264 TaxID=1081102 RepID=A0A162J9S6_9HYPO|nr:hypothetical protein SPI_02569 [Niveomyces insectorum RCEF 264]
MKLAVLVSLAATAVASSISLPSYPLANKTPYLSAWLRRDQAHDLPSARPYFWQGQPLTWQVLARIDGDAYCLFSCTNTTVPPAKQTSLVFTSTSTTATLQAGTAVLTLEFFSPVSPTDYVRQSLPFSYLRVQVTHTRSPTAVVDIMCEIDNTWTGQGSNVQAFFAETAAGSRMFILNGTHPTTYGENNEMATWGNVVLAAHTMYGPVSYQVDSGPNNAAQLAGKGTLTGKTTGYVPSDHLALAYNLGRRPGPKCRASSSASVTFVVGLEQEEAFNQYGAPQTGYYMAKVRGTENIVDHVFADEAAARAEGLRVDQKIVDIGRPFGRNYTDILEASLRQTFAGFQILIPLDTLDTSRANAWMKEISTDGNIQTVADLVPKAFPIFYVLAPDIMRLLLNPLLEYALTWPADFGFHDLGKHYPNATGETVASQEALIVDQTAVMHWMVYAYQKATGDTAYAKPYLAVLRRFADYLADNGLYAAKQMSSVDSIGPTANQTVLAMYSAVALTAFGATTGMDNYTALGRHFASVVMAEGVAPASPGVPAHVTAHFGDPASSWISTYPMGFDKMVGLQTFDAHAYRLQSDWYAGQLSEFGMPFDSAVNYTVGEFLPWCAVTSTAAVRDGMINGIHAYLTNGLDNTPNPNFWYVTGTSPAPGSWPKNTNINKPVVGSYWILAAPGLYDRK